jgi:hypothetical protein
VTICPCAAGIRAVRRTPSRPVRIGKACRPGQAVLVSQQHGEDFADGRFPADGLGWGHVRLDPVAVAAAVLVLDDLPGLGEIGDDAVGGAPGDARPGRDVAQPHAGVVSDAQRHPGVAGQEVPVRYARKLL